VFEALTFIVNISSPADVGHLVKSQRLSHGSNSDKPIYSYSYLAATGAFFQKEIGKARKILDPYFLLSCPPEASWILRTPSLMIYPSCGYPLLLVST
jgi:hypothetical protein